MTTIKELERKAIHAVSYGERIRPVRDWLVLLSLAALLLIASAAWNAWVFTRVEYGQAVGAEHTASGHVDNAVGAAEAVFEKRAQEVERYRSEYQFVDPS